MSYCALSYFSAIQPFNGQKRQVSHALPWNAKPMLLTSRAWSACLHPGPANSPRKRRGAYHQICGS